MPPSSTAGSKRVTETQKVNAVIKDEEQEAASISVGAGAGDLSKEENLLKEYSKELYVYTLDLLNSVRIDNAHKGVNGKAYLLKRTVSDIAVPLKTMAIGASDAAKGTKGAAAAA